MIDARLVGRWHRVSQNSRLDFLPYPHSKLLSNIHTGFDEANLSRPSAFQRWSRVLGARLTPVARRNHLNLHRRTLTPSTLSTNLRRTWLRRGRRQSQPRRRRRLSLRSLSGVGKPACPLASRLQSSQTPMGVYSKTAG